MVRQSVCLVRTLIHCTVWSDVSSTIWHFVVFNAEWSFCDHVKILNCRMKSYMSHYRDVTDYSISERERRERGLNNESKFILTLWHLSSLDVACHLPVTVAPKLDNHKNKVCVIRTKFPINRCSLLSRLKFELTVGMRLLSLCICSYELWRCRPFTNLGRRTSRPMSTFLNHDIKQFR